MDMEKGHTISSSNNSNTSGVSSSRLAGEGMGRMSSSSSSSPPQPPGCAIEAIEASTSSSLQLETAAETTIATGSAEGVKENSSSSSAEYCSSAAKVEQGQGRSDHPDNASTLSATTGEARATATATSMASKRAASRDECPMTTHLSGGGCRRGGHDFYDEGYDDDGDDEEQLNNRIVFDPSKFFGRRDELNTLKDAYYCQMLGCRISLERCGDKSTSNGNKKQTKKKKRWSSGTFNSQKQRHSMASLNENDTTTEQSSIGVETSIDFSSKVSASSLNDPVVGASSQAPLSVPQELLSSSPSSSTSSGPPAVIIEGFSGNGKSALVRRFVKEVSNLSSSPAYRRSDNDDINLRMGRKTNDDGGEKSLDCDSANETLPFFVSGKYQELNRGDQPFSAILEALGSFFDHLYEQDRSARSGGDSTSRRKSKQYHSLARIRTAILDVLGDEIDVLTAVVPALGKIVDANCVHQESKDGAKSKSSSVSAAEATTPSSPTLIASDGSLAWNRLRYIFQKLFGAICSKNRPLILFLDDLQWIDEASVELMETLLDDPTLRYVMFVGALRAEQKNQNAKLSGLLDKLQVASGGYRSFTRIELLNLSIDELGQFVADTLRLDEAEVLPLTEIIYGKTRGNIFFSMQLIEELHRRNILYYSVISFQWEWNLKDIEFESTLSENVIAAVGSKIQTLPQKLQRALVIASYTRSSIDVLTLQELMIADGYDIEDKELIGLLDIAVLEGLLSNTVGSELYRFAHDRIQQASYWMVPSGKERDDLRILIGKKLVELYSELRSTKDWMIFVAADHLNSCTTHGQDILTLVQLNLVCGERAFKLAAYVPASLYLRLALKSLRALSSLPWESHYDLCLRVYRGITNIELCLGNPSGFELGREVLAKGRCFEDKIPTYLALIRATGQNKQNTEALELCKDGLFQLKAIPKRFPTIHLLNDIRILSRLFRRHSDDDVLTLPLCRDESKSIIAEFLTEYAIRSSHCGRIDMYLLGLFRIARMTFENGLFGASGYAFAGYGLFLQNTRSTADEAARMASLARKVLDKTDPYSRPYKSVTLLVTSHFIDAWSQPREKVMESFQQAHRAGMASGNMEMAFSNWYLCNLMAQTTGYPLKPLEETAAEISSQAKRYNFLGPIAMIESSQVVIWSLTGKKPVDWDDLEPPEMSSKHIASHNIWESLYRLLSRLEVGVYFDNPEFAVRMFEKAKPILKMDGSFLGMTKGYFFGALAYIALSKKSCLSRNTSKAWLLGKKLRNFCRTHGLNPLHRALLVEAELLSVRTLSSAKLIVAYDSAIYAAIKIGYTHDAALGMELCGKALLNLGEDQRGHQYLTQARDLWRDYGAYGKVDMIVNQYGRKMDKVALDTLETVGEQQITYGDYYDSGTSLDFDLLTGSSIRADIQMTLAADEAEASRDHHDEVSILTDASHSGAFPGPSGTVSRTS